ncbi:MULTISPECIES: hypothetical protein [Sphingomonas]|jgi:hypothetical protein|uniref:MYXO-CTERM domain-containing protein n=1 Tax=Sphingomonas aerolata TaxID=185951 RepID=A0A2T4YSR0_9SPHN|nr:MULTISPECIES: hypothetical protein [Sphingomonas]RZM32055.1 MAG: hypothetical protein EOP67_29755 [Sphingomonas sp.]KHA63341.1 membrane protein [Sphingomonas sp. Ant20]KQM94910.1 hypothetical protein ASE77_05095 [Sphingomonas sp. Leaf226]MBD8470450.1 hypothetical protein [Sphingomonas sp. CFBP 8765]MBD8640784.1 hypothetical protein [Sphingomonas sp. CFBP 13733]
MKLRPILMVIGVLCALMGFLWIGQGLGYVHWPRSSFMLDQRPWADRGAALAVLGLVLILAARRLRR